LNGQIGYPPGREGNYQKDTLQKSHFLELETIKLMEEYARIRNITRSRALNEIIYQWAELVAEKETRNNDKPI
jgi:hypothetical protein